MKWAAIGWSLGFLLPVLYSYLGYPWLLQLGLKLKKQKKQETPPPVAWPHIAILMAAHNEESVMEKKLQSVLNSDYPADKIRVYVGSDCSDDGTNAILKDWATRNPERIFPVFFDKRTGKPGIINHLQHWSCNHREMPELLVLTDANVMFTSETLRELAWAMQDPSVGVVSAWITNPVALAEGIAQQEKFYVNWENQLKDREGRLFKATIGPAGGCFALRTHLFEAIPEGFPVDDFYWGMCVLEKGFGSVMAPKAICMEDLPAQWTQEFKRKARIARGNYQNLSRFAGLMLAPRGVGFCFVSHKVLRWGAPFLILLFALSVAVILGVSGYPLLLLIWLGLPLIAALLGKILSLLGLNPFLLRAFNYFVAMNLAMLYGFTKYLKGRTESVWEPTRRNA